MEFKHTSVLLHETIDNLAPQSGGTYVDATFGGGGHARYLLSKLDKGNLIGFDQDQYAIDNAQSNFAAFLKEDSQPRLQLVHNNFSHLKEELAKLGISGIDGIYYDLGVSSPQLDQAERGFSYRFDARLDMRMDQSQDFDAYQLVNQYDQKQLADVLYRYGDEKFSRQIARKIVERRRGKPIETTFELVEIIKEAIPAAARRSGGHPAKKSFPGHPGGSQPRAGRFAGIVGRSHRPAQPRRPDQRYYLPVFGRQDRQEDLQEVFRS